MDQYPPRNPEPQSSRQHRVRADPPSGGNGRGHHHNGRFHREAFNRNGCDLHGGGNRYSPRHQHQHHSNGNININGNGNINGIGSGNLNGNRHCRFPPSRGYVSRRSQNGRSDRGPNRHHMMGRDGPSNTNNAPFVFPNNNSNTRFTAAVSNGPRRRRNPRGSRFPANSHRSSGSRDRRDLRERPNERGDRRPSRLGAERLSGDQLQRRGRGRARGRDGGGHRARPSMLIGGPPPHLLPVLVAVSEESNEAERSPLPPLAPSTPSGDDFESVDEQNQPLSSFPFPLFLQQYFSEISSIPHFDVTTTLQDLVDFGMPPSSVPLSMAHLDSSRISEVANRLPVRNITKEQAAEGRKCLICHEKYAEGETVKTLPCFHWYHVQCIGGWFDRNHDTCPECRYSITADAEKALLSAE